LYNIHCTTSLQQTDQKSSLLQIHSKLYDTSSYQIEDLYTVYATNSHINMSKRCIACCSTCRRTNLQHIEVVELGPNSTWIQNTIACNPTNASATMVTSLSSAVAVTADVPSTLHCLTRQTMLQLLNSITRTHVGGSSHVHVCASLKLAGELHSPVNYTGDRIRYIVTAEKYTKVHKRKLLRIAWFCIKSKCKVVLHYTRKDYFC